MAETDMKTISELDTHFNLLDSDSLFPIVVTEDTVKTTEKIIFPALKAQIVGTEYIGTLAAGSTSITFNSATNISDFNPQSSYSVGDKCKYSGKYYMCIVDTTAAIWDTNKVKFVEYPQITADSTVERVFTSIFGVIPTSVALAEGSVTLTFPAQSTNLGVKVRIS